MKKVLIIGYPFPLRRGGSPRLLGLAKYLPEFGWQPIILSAPLEQKPEPQFRIVETSYRDALGFWKKLFRLNPDEDIRSQVKERFGITSKKSLMDFILTRAGEIVNYPDYAKGWEPFAIKAGEKLLQEEKIDAIISTSAPVTTHFVAKKLKSRHRMPWVADLRDLWTQNHNYSYSPIRKWFDKRLELKTLSAADALVTVSQPWAEQLGTLHRGKPVYTITNGFDTVEVNIPPAKLTGKFTITFTGKIYPGGQDPSRFLVALRDLVTEGTMNPDEIEVRLYGSKFEWLDREIAKCGLSAIVKQYGTVPRQMALEKQRESQLLLELNWEGQEGLANCSLKLYEYLAAQRPVLATGGLGNYLTGGLLEETKAGIHAPTTEAVKNSLKELYQEYKLKGKIDYNGDVGKINRYSHREMARRFSEILERLSLK